MDGPTRASANRVEPLSDGCVLGAHPPTCRQTSFVAHLLLSGTSLGGIVSRSLRCLEQARLGSKPSRVFQGGGASCHFSDLPHPQPFLAISVGAARQ